MGFQLRHIHTSLSRRRLGLNCLEIDHSVRESDVTCEGRERVVKRTIESFAFTVIRGRRQRLLFNPAWHLFQFHDMLLNVPTPDAQSAIHPSHSCSFLSLTLSLSPLPLYMYVNNIHISSTASSRIIILLLSAPSPLIPAADARSRTLVGAGTKTSKTLRSRGASSAPLSFFLSFFPSLFLCALSFFPCLFLCALSFFRKRSASSGAACGGVGVPELPLRGGLHIPAPSRRLPGCSRGVPPVPRLPYQLIGRLIPFRTRSCHVIRVPATRFATRGVVPARECVGIENLELR